MEALTTILGIVQKILIAIGAGTAVLGGYHFFDGFKNDNSPAKSDGIKQMISGAGIALLAGILITVINNSLN